MLVNTPITIKVVMNLDDSEAELRESIIKAMKCAKCDYDGTIYDMIRTPSGILLCNSCYAKATPHIDRTLPERLTCPGCCSCCYPTTLGHESD